MKLLNTILMTAVLSLIAFLVYADDQEDTEEDFLSHFIMGKYHLIGKKFNSDETYFGEIQFTYKKDELIFIKSINGNTITGKAKVEKTISKESTVLRLNFNESKKEFEETCLVDSDLDNYARITCQLYDKEQSTKNIGLEAMFIIDYDEPEEVEAEKVSKEIKVKKEEK